MSTESTSFRTVYGLLVALILIRFLPFALGPTWLWGAGQLTLLPTAEIIAFGILGAFVLILPFLSKSQSWGDSLVARFEQRFYSDGSSKLWRMGLVIVAGVIFALFRMPTHFLGDGYAIIGNLSSTTGSWIKWSEKGATLAIIGVRSVLGSPNEGNAILSFQIVSVVSGMVTVWLYVLISGVLSQDPVKRLLTFVTLLFSATILLFFGYVESYPILWPAVAAFLFFSLKYSIHGKGLVPALACLALAIALHLQALIYGPAVLFLLFSRGAGLRWFRRFRILLIGLSTMGIVAGAVLLYLKFGSHKFAENIFLPLLTGKPGRPEYSALCLRHLSDILNLFLLVYPLGFLWVAVAGWRARKRLVDPTAIFLGLMTVGSFLFLLLVDPTLTMPRDWDLFAICWLAPTVLALYLISDSDLSAMKKFILPILLGTIVLAAPFLLANLNEKGSVEQAKQFVDDTPEGSLSTISFITSYYRKLGDTAAVDSLEARKAVLFPEFHKIRQAWELMNAGKMAEAEPLIRALKPDPYSVDYHQCLTTYFTMTRQFDSALVHAQAIIQLQPYLESGYTSLSVILLMQNEPKMALDVLRQGYALNQNYVPTLTGLAAAFMGASEFDSAFYYGTRTIALNPRASQAYYYTAEACIELHRNDDARDYARQYLEVGPGSPGYDVFSERLLKTFPELNQTELPSADSTAESLQPPEGQ
jgi:tetratricopeptide (TPR) repeat protein